MTYEYNSSGIRTRKHYVMPSGVPFTHDYVLDGTNIVKETVDGYVSYTMYFYYDETGVCGLEFNGETYYYLKNIQGDVVKILNASGQVVVEYTYDAWGKVLSTTGSLSGTVGFRNPFRYRGYYYDTETGLYYLNTRYYDPQVGRFLNADSYTSTGQGLVGNNMFAYCGNNPVMRIDENGELFGAIIGGIIGAIGGAIGGAISAAIKGEDVGKAALAGAIGGAIGGATAGAIVEVFISPGTSVLSAACVSGLANAAGGALSSATSQAVNHYLNEGSMDDFNVDWRAVGASAANGAVQGFVFGGITQMAAQDSVYYDLTNKGLTILSDSVVAATDASISTCIAFEQKASKQRKIVPKRQMHYKQKGSIGGGMISIEIE